MISTKNVTLQYGGRELFKSVSMNFTKGNCYGLIGANGAGKSTFLKILSGEIEPNKGYVTITPGERLSVLKQDHFAYDEYDVIRTVLMGNEKLIEIMDEKEKLYSKEEFTEEDGIRISELEEEFAEMDGWSAESDAEILLNALGIHNEFHYMLMKELTGEQKVKVLLAQALFGNPDILLLDEPTNHLDIESIEWLEGYLKDYRGSLVLISHDRKFLDNVTNRTVEIMLGRIHDYKVPYSKYLELRRERLEQQRAAFENQQRMIEKTEEFIEKFRYKPTKSNQVQSRVKQLEKLERIEVDLEDKSALAVKFPPAPRSGDIAYKADDMTVGYGTKVVFSDAQIEVRRGEKVALVGRNGEGKTTLMRVIMGELDPMSGESKVGYNVNIGYYAQNQEDILDKEDTVFGTLDRIAVGDIRLKLRDILGAFLFKGEDIDKKVAVLSGGERARLAMAKLILKPYNLLALDEPTNHMDIRSKDILKQALKSYDGTLIIVSHDRDFLDGLVDKLYEFRDGKVKEHLGGVQDFLERRKLESLSELERHYKPVAEEKPAEVIQKKEEAKQEYQAKKYVSKEEKKIRNRISFLEKKIEEYETKMGEIEAKLMNPGPEDDVMDLTRAYLENKRELDYKMEEWSELNEKLEQ